MKLHRIPHLTHTDHATPEHAVMTDDGRQVIACMFGRATDWHLIGTFNPETDELLALDVHAVDANGEGEPYRTNATLNGEALIYDPRCCQTFCVSDPLAYEAAVRVFPPVEESVTKHSDLTPEASHDA